VNMQLSNDKLIERGTQMVAAATGLDEKRAKKLLLEAGSVKAAIEEYNGSDW
jgi:N-acetylmuramic acid 6-phosphate etherase